MSSFVCKQTNLQITCFQHSQNIRNKICPTLAAKYLRHFYQLADTKLLTNLRWRESAGIVLLISCGDGWERKKVEEIGMKIGFE